MRNKNNSSKIRLLSESALRKKYKNSARADILLPDDKWIFLPSRSLALNWQLGGGLLYGRMIEIFGYESSGKSLLAIDFGVVTQSLGGVVLWGDAEGCFSPQWAIKNGLDPSKVEVYDSNDVEGFSDWCRDMILYYRNTLTNNEPILLILDSIAALECAANMNQSQTDGKAEMGNRAKAIYRMFRYRNHFWKQMGVCVIMINQVRAKMNVSMFESAECLHYDTLIPFVDGRSLPIGKIVKEKIKGDVWSYNEAKSKIEPTEIKAFIEKHFDEKWLSIVTEGPGSKGGLFGIHCTPRHLILTDSGWVFAKDLLLKHKVITKYESIVNGTLGEFLQGTFIGDSSLRKRKNFTGRLRLQDNVNKEYVEWKIEKLKPFIKFDRHNYRYTTKYNVEWALLADKHKNRDPLSVLAMGKPSGLTLAIWYMDDGNLSKRNNPQASISFSTKRTHTLEVVKWMSSWGFECNPKTGGNGIRFTNFGAENFFLYIREFIPGCMQYKLPKDHQGFLAVWSLDCKKETKAMAVGIRSIKNSGQRVYRKNYKYDLSTGNKNFIAGGKENGFIVHNTTPGGQATKYYATQRLSMFPGKQLKGRIISGKWSERDDGQKAGRRVNFQIIKNKIGPPKNSVKSEVYFIPGVTGYVGFSRYHGLPEALELEGVVKNKKHSGYYYKDKFIAKGEEGFLRELTNNDKMRKFLINKSSINTVSKTREKLKSINTNLFPVRLKEIEDEE